MNRLSKSMHDSAPAINDDQSPSTQGDTIGRREFLLLGAGVIIFGVAYWRQQQLKQWSQDPHRQVALARTLAPRFTLADHNRKVVKLERLLGRHRVVLVFFDPNLGIDQDPRTKKLLEAFKTIDAAGIEIIAVSTATPFANEEAEKRIGYELPFPVLTDIDINNPVPTPAHRSYGCLDENSGLPLPALFLIERDGSLPYGPNGFPTAIQDEARALEILAQGAWPTFVQDR